MRRLLEVTKRDNKAYCLTRTDFGTVTIKRTFRKHTKEIRELQKQGIYCFEIQGWLYWYKLIDKTTGKMVEYKQPELFRETQTNELKKSGRSEKQVKVKDNAIEVEFPEVKTIPLPKLPKAEEQKEEEQPKEVKHSMYNIIKNCIENDIPVYLVGEAGTGKNHTLEDISWDLGYEFYFTNSVQQEYKLTGFIDAGGVYHETEFYKAFKNGGIFFLDEIDASIPEVLTLLNAAIANKYFEFPTGRITAHENFRVVAAGNTVGSGADDMYTGRLVLDQATLDRFVIIDFDYERPIELFLAKGNKDLVDFIEDMRKQAKQNRIRCTFSYRCLIQTQKLEKMTNLVTILKIAVFKGLDKDTINSFRSNGTSKYYKALNELQRVA